MLLVGDAQYSTITFNSLLSLSIKCAIQITHTDY